MSEGATPAATTKHRRKRFMVDWRHQLAVTAQLLGVLFGVGLLYAIGLLVLPDQDAMAELASDEARQVFLRANAIYFALGAAILGVVSIMLTHRVAGPAFVLERAVQGMRKGDFSQRLSLRRRDYLKELASAIESFRDEIVAKDAEQRRCATDLLHCIDEKDLDGARELAKRLAAPPPAKAGLDDAVNGSDETADEEAPEEAPTA